MDHRQQGVDLFNGTWRLIESRHDDALMLHMAHASAWHWAAAPECTTANRARGEWLVSRVSALCGLADAARFHAEASLRICEENGLADWDLAFAHEALARAAKVAGDDEAAAAHAARAAAVPIEEADDRELLERDLASI
ncbi:MAG TPA: hypothetical protein VGC78_02515 [Gaiellaceae bacterium]